MRRFSHANVYERVVSRTTPFGFSVLDRLREVVKLECALAGAESYSKLVALAVSRPLYCDALFCYPKVPSFSSGWRMGGRGTKTVFGRQAAIYSAQLMLVRILPPGRQAAIYYFLLFPLRGISRGGTIFYLCIQCA